MKGNTMLILLIGNTNTQLLHDREHHADILTTSAPPAPAVELKSKQKEVNCEILQGLKIAQESVFNLAVKENNSDLK